MIILSYNCRGLGNLWVVPILHELIRTHKPDIIFLFETLVHAQRLVEIYVQIILIVTLLLIVWVRVVELEFSGAIQICVIL